MAGNGESLEALLSSSIVVKRYVHFLSFSINTHCLNQFLISTIKVSMQEAKLAKEKMHGRLACGRPLVVRLSSEKYLIQEPHNPSGQSGEAAKTSLSASSSGQMSRTSKIAAIKNKLKALEGEGYSAKKQKQDNIPCSNTVDHPSVQR